MEKLICRAANDIKKDIKSKIGIDCDIQVVVVPGFNFRIGIGFMVGDKPVGITKTVSVSDVISERFDSHDVGDLCDLINIEIDHMESA